MIKEKAMLQAAVSEGLLSEHDISKAKMIARRKQQDLLTTLEYSHRIPQASFYRAYAEYHKIKFLKAAELTPNVKVAKKCGFSMLKSRKIFPVSINDEENKIHIACSEAPESSLKRQTEKTLGNSIEYYLADERAIETALLNIEPILNPLADVSTESDDFDPVNEINQILDQAYLHRASDVHFEPLKEQMMVRIRVDGRLQELSNRYSIDEAAALLSRIKVLSKLDIAENRIPQDGAMSHQIENDFEFDIRVATMPARFGERATLRLLGTEAKYFSLKELGMADDQLEQFRKAIQLPYGMILLTGPTGSGKSTTLYAALKEINSSDINILTAEDPVEQPIETISQLQVGVKVNFAGALRSFLRHDPDVIMVGEIRDGETADVAMKAAMTGHLVFSTLHTNTAVACVNRLRDIGAETYLIASTLIAAIAQRLARKLCMRCRIPFEIPEHHKEQLSLDENELDNLYAPSGCPHCSGTGYQER
ncbi:MAG: GspE/PulE family protein, partial [Proteobacteria bacterium]|nr:GspE/PulE family protein [Pseudomonadota bacterium]